ncbi:MAG: hypothetical protein CMO66_05795 [Verrucomicrobiales bacterium]|nr:hypothetical protein [Verrucomicrobiales bacterium]
MEVNMVSPNIYSQWRAQRVDDVLHDAPAGPPPERLLQGIWQHQRIRRDRLHTCDGQILRVFHPGFWNYEAGPDFQRAVIQLGDGSPMTGDIEIDPAASDWRAHGHADNPGFGGVILHVVWNGPARTHLPTLRLQPHCDAPLKELSAWYTTAPPFPAEFAGQCRAPLAALSVETLEELLSQAALVRLQTKAAGMTRLARIYGWDAALWQGLFRALGYKHNTWPMQNLAERLPTLHAVGFADSLGWQARLLGCAGFLADDFPTQSTVVREYLRELWDRWWRERDALADYCLPRSLWRMAGLRPANHPARRLVLLAGWMAAGDLPKRLRAWLESDCVKSRRGGSLLEYLQVKPDSFWNHHWTFKSSRQERYCPLLGAARATDLAINVILPWFHARASAGRNRELLSRIESRFHSWPPAQDNRTLKLACQRLFAEPRRLSTAAHQQGLLQIVRDFCDHAPATCDDCQFPALVQSR